MKSPFYNDLEESLKAANAGEQAEKYLYFAAGCLFCGILIVIFW